MRPHKTAIYVLTSVCVILLGVTLLFPFRDDPAMLSVATSLIAGGLASIAFGLIRHFDEVDSGNSASEFRLQLHALSERLAVLDGALEDLRRLSFLHMPQSDRRIFGRHPKEEIMKEIGSARRTIEIDIMALTARSFCQDFLSHLQARGNVSIRFLCQDPRSESFKATCKQEGRDVAAMVEDVVLSTQEILRSNSRVPALPAGRNPETVLEKPGAPSLIAQIRWFTGYPTITMVRVNKVLFLRCRFLKEASQPPMFFERYSAEEGRCFDAYVHYFQTAWDLSLPPTEALVKEAYQSSGIHPGQELPEPSTGRT